MKTCTKCGVLKLPDAFYASLKHKSGLDNCCKQCDAQRNKAKYERRKVVQLAKAKEWRDANKDKQDAATKVWRESNPERTAAMYRNWADRNRDKVNAKWMQRYASKKHRTPAWLTDDDHWMIEQAYDIAAKRKEAFGFDWHVDHIVPLHGKTVSGLHVPWNLQVIPALLNQQKSNHFN